MALVTSVHHNKFSQRLFSVINMSTQCITRSLATVSLFSDGNSFCFSKHQNKWQTEQGVSTVQITMPYTSTYIIEFHQTDN